MFTDLTIENPKKLSSTWRGAKLSRLRRLVLHKVLTDISATAINTILFHSARLCCYSRKISQILCFIIFVTKCFTISEIKCVFQGNI